MKIPCHVGAMAGGRYLGTICDCAKRSARLARRWNALIGTDGRGLVTEMALIRIDRQKNNDETMKRPCSYGAMAGNVDWAWK